MAGLLEDPLCEDELLVATQAVDDRVLKDVVAYVEVRTTNDNRSEAVRRELQQLGATVVKKFSNDVTHVVFKEGSNRTKTKAQKKGVHFVSVLWVDCCKQNQEHVSERMYPAIVPKQKGVSLFITKMKKAKSMQPRDFEEEVSRSAERVNRKQRRLDALDRLHSADSTPQTSPRMSRILVQDTQPRSPDEGFILTPIRLTIPDTPPSMREKMKQLKIGGSYNEEALEGRKPSSKDYMYDKEPLQRKLFMSAGVSFGTSSFNSPGSNSVFTSEDDETKDISKSTSQVSDNDDTEVDGEGCSPAAVVRDKVLDREEKSIETKQDVPQETKTNYNVITATETNREESDSSITDDILDIAGKINTKMNKNTALDDSLNIDSDVKVDCQSAESRNSEDKEECTKLESNSSSDKEIPQNRSKKRKIKSNLDKKEKSEIKGLKQNERRKSSRMSLQIIEDKTQNDDITETTHNTESTSSVGDNDHTYENNTAAEIVREDKDLKAAPSVELPDETASSKSVKEVDENNLNGVNFEESKTGKRSNINRRRTYAAEKEASKSRTMPKKKLLSLTDLNEPHSVLIEPTKSSTTERTELVDNKPKRQRGRKKKVNSSSDESTISVDPGVQGNKSLKPANTCDRNENNSDISVVNINSTMQKKSKANKKVPELNNENIENIGNLEHQLCDKKGRKRNSTVINNSDQGKNNKRRTREAATSQNKENDNTITENKGRKRKSKSVNLSQKHQKKNETDQSEVVIGGKELVRVNDTIVNEREESANNVTSQLQDITTQINLTANNSVTASLRDGTLSLSMSTIYNTDTTMPFASQRKSIDEFNLSQRNRNMERSRVVVGKPTGVRRELGVSSSDSDNSISGKPRKKFRPSLVMTSLHSHEQDVVISVVKKLGGFVIAENVNETTTHVIYGDPRRTLNVLQCVARGAWLLHKSWVMQSLEAGSWIAEEDFECDQFFPVCKIARLERESTDGHYKQTLFSRVGLIYVSGRSSPPRPQLVQLIKLCGGHVTGVLNKASVYVGSDFHPGITCLKTQWILECITQHRVLPMEKFSLDRPKREASPVY